MNFLEPDYRHTTSDIWEAAALWANGQPISHTERDGETVIFCFSAGPGVAEAADVYHRGDLRVSALQYHQGYMQMRALMRGVLGPQASRARRR